MLVLNYFMTLQTHGYRSSLSAVSSGLYLRGIVGNASSASFASMHTLVADRDRLDVGDQAAVSLIGADLELLTYSIGAILIPPFSFHQKFYLLFPSSLMLICPSSFRDNRRTTTCQTSCPNSSFSLTHPSHHLSTNTPNASNPRHYNATPIPLQYDPKLERR